jgi:hypothetical protein
VSKFLATFSGRFGDILWSLPTVRALSQMNGAKFDFACMPQYRSLLPLLSCQSYIDKAFVLEDWICTGSPHGDQPWHPPKHVEATYERCWHLTYKGHPGINAEPLPLPEFIAHQQGLSFHGMQPRIWLNEPLSIGIQTEEFTRTVELYGKGHYLVAVGFNASYPDEKCEFLRQVVAATYPHMEFVNIAMMPWCQAVVALLNYADVFMGCRSANYVLAHGTEKQVLTYEPDSSRNEYGPYGQIFGCPWGKEWAIDYRVSMNVAVQKAVELLNSWREEKENAIATSVTRGSC